MLITKEYQGIEYFDAWSGARYTKDRIIEEGKADEFDNFVESYFFEGEVDEAELNDFLWFEDEFIFEELGISNDDDEDDDEDEEDY